MKVYLKKIIIFIIIILLSILYLYIANISLMPKSITLLEGEKLELATLWGIKLNKENSAKTDNNETVEASSNLTKTTVLNSGKTNMNVSLFKRLDIANITVNVIPKTTVIPLGNAVGLKLYTQGVLVVGMSEVEGERPYENTGIEEGDRIISINDKKVTSTDELVETVNSTQGKEVEVKYINNENKESVANILPVKSKDNQYKLGLWVRDAAAGVGTATFYEPSTGLFSSLGHGITDVDTGNLITIANGELVNSNIISIIKAEKGKPGEIRGSIEGQKKIGNIYKNTSYGIFGKISNEAKLQIAENEMEVLSRNEIKKGKAQIICQLENGKKESYDIEIQKIYTSNNKDNKSMLIEVTDQRLLEKTGGIIQGMSGSPIIQDGKFVGAVTHVLVNNPKQGYAVFADMMIKQLREVK